MASNVYEGMFILDSGRYSRDPEAVSGSIPQAVRQAGGEVMVSRLWEERRLAYPIQGQRKGTYWLTYFRLDSGRLAEVKRQCQLNESILRFLFLRVDPRIVDALVEHAKSGHAAVPAEKPAEGRKSDDGERPRRERVGAGSRTRVPEAVLEQVENMED
ncbi:MAG: 30S ribosomal protein S6 [Pirellulales bacterium]|nr:30S ribosomal protein S6 [Pirellulales bacterium]